MVLHINIIYLHLFDRKTRQQWSDFLNKSPERYDINLPELPENKGTVTYIKCSLVNQDDTVIGEPWVYCNIAVV